MHGNGFEKTKKGVKSYLLEIFLVQFSDGEYTGLSGGEGAGREYGV